MLLSSQFPQIKLILFLELMWSLIYLVFFNCFRDRKGFGKSYVRMNYICWNQSSVSVKHGRPNILHMYPIGMCWIHLIFWRIHLIRYLSQCDSEFTLSSQEKAIDSLPKPSQVANRSNGPPYVQPMMLESDDGISYKG